MSVGGGGGRTLLVATLRHMNREPACAKWAYLMAMFRCHNCTSVKSEMVLYCLV